MKKIIVQTFAKNRLWLGVNAVVLLLLVRLVWMVADAPFSFGPTVFSTGAQQNIVLFSGKTALILLVASLVCTPAARFLRLHSALKMRKSLGLWSAFFACFHALYFMGGKNLLLEGEAWLNVWQMLPSTFSGVTKTPYARYGAYALTLLLLLAATSNRLAMRNLGKNWKRLHRLVYLAAPLAVYHYWQREEVMKTVEPPDYWQPVTFAMVVALLLMVRIPFIGRTVTAWLSMGRLRQRLRVAKHPVASPILAGEAKKKRIAFTNGTSHAGGVHCVASEPLPPSLKQTDSSDLTPSEVGARAVAMRAMPDQHAAPEQEAVLN